MHSCVGTLQLAVNMLDIEDYLVVGQLYRRLDIQTSNVAKAVCGAMEIFDKVTSLVWPKEEHMAPTGLRKPAPITYIGSLSEIQSGEIPIQIN